MDMDDGLKACERLVHAFAWHIDHHDAEQAAGLFAEDAVFERRGEALKGRDAIRSAFVKRPASVLTRHLCSNLLLNAESATRIVGRSYFTLYRGDGAAGLPQRLELPEFVGEYHDLFERTDQGWRIAHRRAHAVFQRTP